MDGCQQASRLHWHEARRCCTSLKTGYLRVGLCQTLHKGWSLASRYGSSSTLCTTSSRRLLALAWRPCPPHTQACLARVIGLG